MASDLFKQKTTYYISTFYSLNVTYSIFSISGIIRPMRAKQEEKGKERDKHFVLIFCTSDFRHKI